MSAQLWSPVMVNLNHSKPLWGVRRSLGPYLRKPPTPRHPSGELVTTSDSGEAQQWADGLNAKPT
ncbi:hypothetical protein [Mycobacterium hubeiense]|uniref:hypothetical protein n=1 Tax=Mycobacterium hubeiense TaxID=1867256 RepID=UPI001156FCB6|nr:hypothetical protein [Mycobacterium sp. QGD 101]